MVFINDTTVLLTAHSGTLQIKAETHPSGKHSSLLSNESMNPEFVNWAEKTKWGAGSDKVRQKLR